MKLNSLAFRLFAASALWLLIVLPVAGWILTSVYRQDVERVFNLRLDTAWWALVNLSNTTDSPVPRPPAATAFGDPSYNLPASGWYWQIEELAGGSDAPLLLLSPSLQGQRLTLPVTGATVAPGDAYSLVDGLDRQGHLVRFASKVLTAGKGAEARQYRYIVTGNLAEADVALRRFSGTLALALFLLGAGLAAAIYFQVRYGLRPLLAIERGLGDIRSGKAKRLEGEFPSEIAPLQRELNALLKSNEDVIERARTHVGNLAHALKTPLSVLTNEARTEATPLAQKVAEQTAIMRDQVQHHLDRARMVARSGGLGGVTEVKPVIEALGRVLRRVHAGKDVEIVAECPAGLVFQGEKQDLEEMLGNLMDNACKWAHSRVAIAARAVPAPAGSASQPVVVIDIADDGPGLTDAERAEVGKRGRRLDESKPGSGLGLSIVTELAALYGGSLRLERSSLGGLNARLCLPSLQRHSA